ncbi:MAG: diacylglycerol kinase family protein [Desulfocurvibacter africanus]
MDKDGVEQQTALDPRATRPVRPLHIKAVVNAGAGITPAGKRADIAGSLEQAFAQHGLQAEIELVQAEEFEAAVERAASGPWDAVAAGGGDGSISSAARILARADKPMAVLPMGTWNYFARLLNIPLDLDGAVAVMAAGRFGPVDAMEVNGRFFVSHCTLGIHPRFVRERVRLQHSRGWYKPLAIVWALVKSFVRYPVLLVEVQHEARREVLRTPFVMAGNSLSALNPLTVPTHLASLSDGLLALILGRRLGRMGLMASALHTFHGRLDPEKDFRLILVPECAVRVNRRRVRATLDGELTWLTPPLRFRILPHALTLLLPESAAKAKAQQASTGPHGPAV